VNFFGSKRILFIALFAALSIIAYNINFSSVLGAESQSFTFFQFFGPTTGMFLGPYLGAVSVFIATLSNFFILGKGFSLFSIARLFPMVLAAAYFGSRKRKYVSVVPLACMALFIIHPTGMQAWFYSLYWLIPLLAAFKKHLFLKSLGATFTAHALGSVAFLYLFPTTPAFWIALIPIVYVERMMFASGISLSYIAFNTVLSKIGARLPLGVLRLDKKYAVRLNGTA